MAGLVASVQEAQTIIEALGEEMEEIQIPGEELNPVTSNCNEDEYVEKEIKQILSKYNRQSMKTHVAIR